MRSAKYSVVNVEIGAVNPAPLVPASPHRVALMIAPIDATNPFYVTPDPTAPALVGIRVAADTGPLTLRIEEFGDIVQNAWYAGSWTAAQLVAVVDVTDSPRRRS